MAWIALNQTKMGGINRSIEVCPIKITTGLPCPSCGTTRSITSILKGDYSQAATINPLGFLLFTLLLVLPIWSFVDLLNAGKSLWTAYQAINCSFKKPILAYPLIVLVLLNWFWNMHKGL
jgi:hypothetical protein